MGAQIRAELTESQARSGQPVEADVAYRIDSGDTSSISENPPQGSVTRQPGVY
jgi:hypothetical protein